jgi:hypothetical protein
LKILEDQDVTDIPIFQQYIPVIGFLDFREVGHLGLIWPSFVFEQMKFVIEMFNLHQLHHSFSTSLLPPHTFHIFSFSSPGIGKFGVIQTWIKH